MYNPIAHAQYVHQLEEKRETNFLLILLQTLDLENACNSRESFALPLRVLFKLEQKDFLAKDFTQKNFFNGNEYLYVDYIQRKR